MISCCHRTFKVFFAFNRKVFQYYCCQRFLQCIFTLTETIYCIFGVTQGLLLHILKLLETFVFV